MSPRVVRRSTALAVLRRLRAKGHVAYFVGGAVRDQLLGIEPTEFDVATSATPEQVQALFPHTIGVGAQFGVIMVMYGREDVEVATFRSDDAYVDGRRPSGVRFATAREDAERRDFTINGLFLDPETDAVLDYVGGLDDLKARRLRAIGDAHERFREDKLRMLRAVRFAATGPFDIDPATWDALLEMAPEISVVSQERVRAELEKILVSGRSAEGFRLLHASGLLREILPEIAAMDGVAQPPQFHKGTVWEHTLMALEQFDAIDPRPLELGLATLLHDVGKPPTFQVLDRIRFNGHAPVGARMTEEILVRLRFPKAVIRTVRELVARHMAFVDIRKWREAKVRRFVTDDLAEEHLALHRIDCLASHGSLETWKWMRTYRERVLAEPPPPRRLVTGKDLLELGFVRGPAIGKALADLDDEILEGRVRSRQEALEWLLHVRPNDPETEPEDDPG